MRFLRHTTAWLAMAMTLGWSGVVVADHAPSSLSQDVDPNYIACMMSVDDAGAVFLHAVQSACFERMGDICSAPNGTAPSIEIIECIHVETQRGLKFVEAAVNDLPKTVDMGGFFGSGYEKRRDGILTDVEALKKLPMPHKVDVVAQQAVTTASVTTTLFWLARETGTPVEAHVEASFGDH